MLLLCWTACLDRAGTSSNAGGPHLTSPLARTDSGRGVPRRCALWSPDHFKP